MDIKTTKNGDLGQRLHSFIISLPPKAKENFSKYSKLKGRTTKLDDEKEEKSKVTDQLFNLLNSQSSFNTEEVKQLFPSHKDRLTTIYHRLEIRLRASLVWFSNDREGEIMRLYREVKEMIRYGGDYGGAYKLNKQVIELCRVFDYPDLEIKALQQRSKILGKLELFKEMENAIPEFIEDIDDARERANSIVSFEFGFSFYRSLFKQNYHARQEADERHLEALIKHKTYSKIRKAVTPKAKIYYWMMRYLCAVFVEDWKSCINTTKSILKIFKAYPGIVSDLEEIYLEQICRLALVYSNVDPIKGKKYQLQLQNYESPSKEITAQAKCGYWKAIIGTVVDGHSPPELVLNSIEILKDFLVAYQRHISTENLYNISLFIGRVYFENGDFETAQEWFSRIIENPQKHIRRDLQGISRILFLLCMTEMNLDPEILDKKARIFKNWLKKQEKFSEFEKRIYNHINVYPFPENTKSKKQMYSNLLEDLKEIFNMKYEKKINYYFDFINFVSKKLNT